MNKGTLPRSERMNLTNSLLKAKEQLEKAGLNMRNVSVALGVKTTSRTYSAFYTAKRNGTPMTSPMIREHLPIICLAGDLQSGKVIPFQVSTISQLQKYFGRRPEGTKVEARVFKGPTTAELPTLQALQKENKTHMADAPLSDGATEAEVRSIEAKTNLLKAEAANALAQWILKQ